MQSFGNAYAVYLDQNVYSALRTTSEVRDDLLHFLRNLIENGAICTYSNVHVDESRNSSRPEEFCHIFDSLPAYFIDSWLPESHILTLSPHRARELILGEHDAVAVKAEQAIERLLLPLQYLSGFLKDLQADEVREELLKEMSSFSKLLKEQLPSEVFSTIAPSISEVSDEIRELPLQRLEHESDHWLTEFRARIPVNYAQLDAVPDERVVEFMFKRMAPEAQVNAKSDYPRGFWLDPSLCNVGRLSSLGLLLFSLGLIRDRKMKKGDRSRREKRFRGQFRDCQHIEAAASCSVFITRDAKAARLARAIYSYAGVQTKVALLTF
jgi:hypothetical protein